VFELHGSQYVGPPHLFFCNSITGVRNLLLSAYTKLEQTYVKMHIYLEIEYAWYVSSNFGSSKEVSDERRIREGSLCMMFTAAAIQ